jgi:hypothetical protein
VMALIRLSRVLRKSMGITRPPSHPSGRPALLAALR